MSEAAFGVALERVYDRFSGPAPRVIDGCPCCIDRKTAGLGHSKPLRELTSAELGPYAASVFLTVGAELDFRYFLPRILELSAREAGWYPTPEIVLGKLELARWQTWPEKDRGAVQDFIEAWWERLLSEEDDAGQLDGVICGIARSGLDIDPFLERLLTHPAALAAIVEASIWLEWENSSKLPRNPFWEDCPDKGLAYAEFLRSERVAAALGIPT